MASSRLRFGELPLSMLALLALAAACSSSGPVRTASATISGPTVGVVRSAALIESGTIIPDSGLVGAPSTYVQFFSDPPGSECAALDAGTVNLAGSLSVPGDPSKLGGRTLAFGSTPDLLLSLNAAPGSVDASAEVDAGGGGPAPAPTLYAVSGTVALTESGGVLNGVIDAQMAVGTDPGGPTVHVTGTFSAPACGD